MTPDPPKERSALTLLETLVVMALLGMLLSVLMVSIQQTREIANRACCQAHLKNLALSVHNYHSVQGKMPPYASGRPNEIYGGWYMHLLPFVERGALYETICAGQFTNSNGLTIATTGSFLPAAMDAVFPELVCASDPTRKAMGGDNTTNYLANWYALSDGVRGTYRSAQPFESLTNGMSNVVLFAEAYTDCSDMQRLALYSASFHNFGITGEGLPSDDSWYAPTDYFMFQVRPEKCDNWRTQTPHSVMHVALADGSARSVLPTIAPETWKSVLKARDGAIPGPDW